MIVAANPIVASLTEMMTFNKAERTKRISSRETKKRGMKALLLLLLHCIQEHL